MKILRSITVNMTPDELNKAVKEYLEKEGFEVHEVNFKVCPHTEGFGTAEHTTYALDGCDVKCRIITNKE